MAERKPRGVDHGGEEDVSLGGFEDREAVLYCVGGFGEDRGK
jgi:hypothetical protein